MKSPATISDAEILDSIVSPGVGGFTSAAAHGILDLKFDSESTKRIRSLLQKNNRGTISAEERIALEKYLRVGKLIDLLQAKARLSLKEFGEVR